MRLPSGQRCLRDWAIYDIRAGDVDQSEPPILLPWTHEVLPKVECSFCVHRAQPKLPTDNAGRPRHGLDGSS